MGTGTRDWSSKRFDVRDRAWRGAGGNRFASRTFEINDKALARHKCQSFFCKICRNQEVLELIFARNIARFSLKITVLGCLTPNTRSLSSKACSNKG